MTQSPSAAHTVQQGDERRSVASTSPPIEAGSRTVRSLMRDQPPSSPAEALRREEHGQQQSAMANVEAAVRALRLFIIEVEQGAAAASRGPHAADSVHLELMPSSFRSLQRLARRLDEAFTLLTQFVGDKGLVAALDELAPRGTKQGEPPSSRALRQRIQESELKCAQLEERIAELEAENNVLLEEPPRNHQDHLVPTALVSKLVEEYDTGRALLEQKVAMELQRRQSAVRRAEAAEREIIELQQSLTAANAATNDASARLTAERLRVEQLERKCEEVETARAEQEIVAQRAIGRVEVLHSELHGKTEAMAKLHDTLANRTQQCAALRADCDRMRSEPLRIEMAGMSQQLQREVKAREEMSEVWEQLLEGNARLRREKAMLENAISDAHTLPHYVSHAGPQGDHSIPVSPSSWQHRPQGNGASPDNAARVYSPGPSASASHHTASPTLLNEVDAVPLSDLRGHGLVDRGYGLSHGSPGESGSGGDDP